MASTLLTGNSLEIEIYLFITLSSPWASGYKGKVVLWFAFAVLVSSFVYPVRKVFDCVVYRFCVNSHVLCVVFIVVAAENYVVYAYVAVCVIFLLEIEIKT